MPGKNKINFSRIKFMYLYTIIGAGGFGLGIILIPDIMKSLFGWPDQDPIVYGVMRTTCLHLESSLFLVSIPFSFVFAKEEIQQEITNEIN